jgi:hypothetical protein
MILYLAYIQVMNNDNVPSHKLNFHEIQSIPQDILLHNHHLMEMQEIIIITVTKQKLLVNM